MISAAPFPSCELVIMERNRDTDGWSIEVTVSKREAEISNRSQKSPTDRGLQSSNWEECEAGFFSPKHDDQGPPKNEESES